MINLSAKKIMFENKKVDSLIPYLREEMKLSYKFTLENFFQIIEKELDLYNAIFTSYLGEWPLKCFVDEINKKKTSSCDDINYLEICWGCNLLGEGSHPNNVFEVWPIFHGVEKDISGQKINIMIMAADLNDIKNCPIRIDNEISFDTIVNGKNKCIFSGKKKFTVFEFISAIFMDISFYGSPKNSDKIWEERDKKLKKLNIGEK